MVHILNSTGGSEQINLIRYEFEPSDKHKREMRESTPLITIDWESIIPPPPSNTSELTQIDLEQVQRTRDGKIDKSDIALTHMLDACSYLIEYKWPIVQRIATSMKW